MREKRAKKVSYSAGDLFLVPSCQGGFYIGQIVVDARLEIGANFCFLTRKKVEEEHDCKNVVIESGDVISAMLITPELIDYGSWKLCGNRDIPKHEAENILAGLRKKSYVGAAVIGAGLVAKYLDTYFGLISDSYWPDPAYVYENFLVPRSKLSMAHDTSQSKMP